MNFKIFLERKELMKILGYETQQFEELKTIKILFVTGGCGFVGSNFINI